MYGNQIMLIFVDESGDTGSKRDSGASDFFIVAVVVFIDRIEAQACDTRISLLRRELRLPEYYEFKFSRMRKRHRLAFLEAVKLYSFTYVGLIADKRKSRSEKNETEQNLGIYYALALNALKKHLRDATVVLDGTASRVYKKRFKTFLRLRTVAGVHKVKLQSSHANNLLQLADMVAGALHRSMSNKADSDAYRSLVRQKESKIIRYQ